MKNQTRYAPMRPYEPAAPSRNQYVLAGSQQLENIYYDVTANDEDLDLDEYFEGQDEPRPPVPEKRYWQHLSLQDIVDLAPEGTKLSDIILDIYNPRNFEYTAVSFKHIKRDMEMEENQYQQAVVDYQKEMDKYQKELAVYKAEAADFYAWKKQIQIEELESKLAKLKK
jgi:hypothetical protein